MNARTLIERAVRGVSPRKLLAPLAVVETVGLGTAPAAGALEAWSDLRPELEKKLGLIPLSLSGSRVNGKLAAMTARAIAKKLEDFASMVEKVHTESIQENLGTRWQWTTHTDGNRPKVYGASFSKTVRTGRKVRCTSA